MSFWGVTIGPGKSYVHKCDPKAKLARLRVSKATLVTTEPNERAVVLCTVDKKNVHLCSLLPREKDNCTLFHEFEETDDVTFSVKGPHTIHLSGFYYGETQTTLEEKYPINEEIVSDEDDLTANNTQMPAKHSGPSSLKKRKKNPNQTGGSNKKCK